MVAETSDSMPTASITTCCCFPCYLYLSRVKLHEPHEECWETLYFKNDTWQKVKAVFHSGSLSRNLLSEFLRIGFLRSGNGNRASHFKTVLPAGFFFLYDLLLLSFYKTPLQLDSVVSVLFQLNSLFFFLFYTSQLMRCVWFPCVGFLWAVPDILHGLVSFFLLLFIYLPFFCLDCFDGIKHSFASMQLNAFQHDKLSTTVNSIHFPLHPSCLLFLPVAQSIIGFRCQLYCENLAKSKNGINA